MNKANIVPKDIVSQRLATLRTEREHMVLDLERDIEESKERGDIDIIREDQNFWRDEIYKYDFCIEELERILIAIK